MADNHPSIGSFWPWGISKTATHLKVFEKPPVIWAVLPRSASKTAVLLADAAGCF
ncbi:MAG: hypothetical protein SOR45_05220 [Collinsella bouchesdurhonensis]|uniref:hypothetical protein n=1 Tax=Collinsella bouchesdurhonensis TaxID=1907654 RepID=UPI001E4B660D|nr:hypothetical protein [Collinsella bouchesdurhonensis]MCI5784997.1 hypothetical protein [Collinsella bouchesdurhonensis]MDY3053884.1 hypothetical protein [Collinsella bouchesdurhonensis]